MSCNVSCGGLTVMSMWMDHTNKPQGLLKRPICVRFNHKNGCREIKLLLLRKRLYFIGGNLWSIGQITILYNENCHT